MTKLDDVLSNIDANLDAALARLFAILRIKSISTDPAYKAKGQLMAFIEACRAWKAVTGKLPIPISILLEGEEESGGVNLPGFLDAHAAELRANIGLICDTNMWDTETPAIQTMLRGLCGEEVIIHAADRDLHSGFYGLAAANPNRILARILSDLYDDNGRVTLRGFYDGVPELPEALREQWDSLNFSAKSFLGAIGLSIPAGETGRDALEMVWSRPTCEINGMGGGYQGAGFKTVIPATASAKVSFRLVFDQDPMPSATPSGSMCIHASRPIAAWNSWSMARVRRSASRSRLRPSARRATR